VEKLVEEDEITPGTVLGIAWITAVARAVALCIWLKEMAHAPGDLMRGL
jgi:hypothetical protein